MIRAPRLGLAVAVRVAGGAVGRNRLRRMIRESFRLDQRELPAVDVVVGARPPVRVAAAPATREPRGAVGKVGGTMRPVAKFVIRPYQLT